MPLYEYLCGACGHRFELIQKFSDGPPDSCPACGKGPLQRLLSSPAIQFKGSGWYVTDYARKEQSGAGGSKDGAASAGGGSHGDGGATSESGTKSDPVPAAASPSTTVKSGPKD
jgi:putative FmdB family regulatory protein